MVTVKRDAKSTGSGGGGASLAKRRVLRATRESGPPGSGNAWSGAASIDGCAAGRGPNTSTAGSSGDSLAHMPDGPGRCPSIRIRADQLAQLRALGVAQEGGEQHHHLHDPVADRGAFVAIAADRGVVEPE